MKYWSTIILFLVCNATFAQIKKEETRLNCIAYWKKGEEKTYLITRKKEKMVSGKAANSPDFLIETKMTVLDSSAAGYTIRWVYGIPHELEKNSMMYQAAAFMQGMKFVYKTDELGTFTELINWEEIRDFYVKMLELQFQGQKKDSTMQKIIDQTLALFKTREMVESTMIKEIQLFHGPYGVAFSTKDTSVNTQIIIPITSDPMPSIKRWGMEEIGTDNDIFKLVMMQKIDSTSGAKVIENVLNKYGPVENVDMKKMRQELSSFEVDDNTEYIFVRSTGWLKAYSSTRIAGTPATRQVETYSMKLRE